MLLGVNMLENIPTQVEAILTTLGYWAPLVACLLILIESILPVLPLFVFITINFICFGSVFGFIMSWLFTCIGCVVSYFLVKKGFNFFWKRGIREASLMDRALTYVSELPLATLTALLACPFTPAFVMNIAAGLANMNFKKFLVAILISKLFLVYFWGFVGTGIIESFKSPEILVKVLIMVLVAYMASVIINKLVKDKTDL